MAMLDYRKYGFTVQLMKTTVELPDELVFQAKRRALEKRSSFRQIVEDALRKELETVRSATTPVNEPGYRQPLTEPLFACEDSAPALDMTLEQLIELEHQTLLDEDIRRAGHSL